MSTIHIVQQGENLSSIARQYGFTSWRSVYDHPDNASFRQRRPNPHVIFPGDEIIIPSPGRREATLRTGAEHRVTIRHSRLVLCLDLQYRGGYPMEDVRYELDIGDEHFQGRTEQGGRIMVPIDPDDREGELRLWPYEPAPDEEPFEDDEDDDEAVADDDDLENVCRVLPLKISHLDPAHKAAGLQARLNNLGYCCGSVDGVIGTKTRAALRLFRAAHGIEDPVSDGSEPTHSGLEDRHGS